MPAADVRVKPSILVVWYLVHKVHSVEWEETGMQVSLFWLWAKADKQRLGLLLVFGAAAAAAEQTAYRGVNVRMSSHEIR